MPNKGLQQKFYRFYDFVFLVVFFFFFFCWFWCGWAASCYDKFLVLNRPNSIKARFYYYSWYVVFYILTIGVGIMARILIPINDSFDYELAMPSLSAISSSRYFSWFCFWQDYFLPQCQRQTANY